MAIEINLGLIKQLFLVKSLEVLIQSAWGNKIGLEGQMVSAIEVVIEQLEEGC